MKATRTAAPAALVLAGACPGSAMATPAHVGAGLIAAPPPPAAAVSAALSKVGAS
jgi:hypothetical protein